MAKCNEIDQKRQENDATFGKSHQKKNRKKVPLFLALFNFAWFLRNYLLNLHKVQNFYAQLPS